MAGSNESPGTKFRICVVFYLWLLLLILSLPSSAKFSLTPEKVTGVYFPSTCLYGRSFEGIVHYMEAAGLNMAVLHAKDPEGRLFWSSVNPIAINIGAPAHNGSLEKAIHILKQKGIWTVAKLDVFQDSLLVTNHPEMGVKDSKTGELWADRKGLHWANRYTKAKHITNLIIKDLDANPRRMRPSPIYIDWDSESIFTKSDPSDRLELYRSHTENLKSVIAGTQR